MNNRLSRRAFLASGLGGFALTACERKSSTDAQPWTGGIVGASDPDRELAETELKFRAMLQALGVPAHAPQHGIASEVMRADASVTYDRSER